MNIRYSKKKDDLREDPVLEFFLAAKNAIVEKSNLLLAIVVGLVVIFGGYGVYSSMQQGRIAKAQEAFGKAMIAYAGPDRQKAIEALAAVTETQSGTPHAAYSAFLLGSILSRDGRYDEARRWFEMAQAKSSKNNLVGALAVEAIATCYEQTGNREQAMELLEKAIRSPALKYRSNAIRWKMALIARDQGNVKRSEELCRAIAADTTALRYKSLAENLLIELRIKAGG